MAVPAASKDVLARFASLIFLAGSIRGYDTTHVRVRWKGGP